MYDMLIKYIVNAHFKIFIINERIKKEMGTKSKPNFNNIKKASYIMMGIITEFHLDWRRQGMFFLDGIRQTGKPAICYFI